MMLAGCSQLLGLRDLPIDAAPPADAAIDGALDAPTDAPVDAPSGFQPACMTNPAYAAAAGHASRYRVATTSTTYDDATAACFTDGAHLVTIRDSSEQAYVSILVAGSAAWIGYDDLTTEGTFTWVSGATSTYTNWALGEPNNGNGSNEDCVYAEAGGGWNDTPCSDTYPAVCECEPGYHAPAVPACMSGSATGWTEVTGRRYKLRAASSTWMAAETACASSGATLFVPSDSFEDTQVSAALTVGLAWIGLSSAGSAFTWVNGAPLAYTDWGDGEPAAGSGCAMMFEQPWYSEPCSSTEPAVCECDPAPP
jgi:hypothetical protein